MKYVLLIALMCGVAGSAFSADAQAAPDRQKRLVAAFLKSGKTLDDYFKDTDVLVNPGTGEVTIKRWPAEIPLDAVDAMSLDEASVIISTPAKYRKTDASGRVTAMTDEEKQEVDAESAPADVKKDSRRLSELTKEILVAAGDPRGLANKVPYVDHDELFDLLDTIGDPVVSGRLYAKFGAVVAVGNANAKKKVEAVK